jgi:SAM-dependent methyltransferase
LKATITGVLQSLGLFETVSKLYGSLDPRAIRIVLKTAYRTVYRNAPYWLRGSPDGLPIPPARLHFLVSGDSDSITADYFEIGEACARMIDDALNKLHVDIKHFRAILDFGCGCGRVIRRIRPLTKATLHGTDYNSTLIDWCRRNLPIAEFRVNQLTPPLAYHDATFDLVYALSVFTHLPETLQFAWIAELSRVLQPGGYLLMTVHGQAHAQYLPPEVRAKLETERFLVLGQEVAGTNQCVAYHLPEYVQKLASGFEVSLFQPGEAFVDTGRRIVSQDFYLLRKLHHE